LIQVTWKSYETTKLEKLKIDSKKASPELDFMNQINAIVCNTIYL